MTKWLSTSLLIAAALTAPAAQSLDPISAEDTLNVRTATVLDLSDDARRVAIGVRRLADNATTDHRRIIAGYDRYLKEKAAGTTTQR